MAKLIFACGLLSSVSLIEPAQLTSVFGPTAHGVVMNIQSALSIDTVMPGLKRVTSR
jgi:hypothetical protein